jgi:hypothetical protein
MTPKNTDWRYFDGRPSYQQRSREYDALQKFVERDTMTHTDLRLWPFVIALAVSGSILAVIGIAVFATVGVLAGFIER